MIQGPGFRVWSFKSLELWVQGIESLGLGFRVGFRDSYFWVQGLGFRVQGKGLRV